MGLSLAMLLSSDHATRLLNRLNEVDETAPTELWLGASEGRDVR